VKAPRRPPAPAPQGRRTIIEALEDRRLFGGLPAFRDLTSWRRWLVFLKAVYGLAMDAGELAIFRHHTRRSAPRPAGYAEAVAAVGRQSGKTRIAATIATYEAISVGPEADGTDLYALLVAQDQRAAFRTLLSYAKAPFTRLPTLRQAVLGRPTRESVRLANGVTMAAYPCRPAALRGPRACCAVCDELAHFLSTEGNPVDVEMLRALRPTLATTGGKLIVLSSPYGQTGALWDLHRQHFGRDDSGTLIWQGSAAEMNPLLPPDYLARMEQDDPEAYRSEVLGEFRTGQSVVFDPAALDACVDPGVRERPYVPGLVYAPWWDGSSGRGDAAALGIAHPEGDRAVLDCVRVWPAPFNPVQVIGEAVALLRAYGLGWVQGDAYAKGFMLEAFQALGVEYVPAPLDRSALYLEALALVNSERAVLLDQPALLRELRGLQRRRGTAGRDKVDHRAGGHDDQANVACGALVLARQLGSAAAVDLEPTPEERAQVRALGFRFADGNEIFDGDLGMWLGDLNYPRW
jgi:hypothetical protein